MEERLKSEKERELENRLALSRVTVLCPNCGATMNGNSWKKHHLWRQLFGDCSLDTARGVIERLEIRQKRTFDRKKNIYIGHGTFIGTNVTIENDVTVSHDCRIGDNAILRRGCRIGARSSVARGVEIGENATIGYRSFVLSNIPPNTVACGFPAAPRAGK